MARGQEVRPFLQMEKYYSHYRGATKVWPSRSFPSRWTRVCKGSCQRTVFYQAILPTHNILSKSRHRPLPSDKSIKITRLCGFVGLERNERSRRANYQLSWPLIWLKPHLMQWFSLRRKIWRNFQNVIARSFFENALISNDWLISKITPANPNFH